MVTYSHEAVFDALADGTRRAILDQLAEGERSAGDLSECFPVSRPAISRHLRVLLDAGLVTRRKEAQWRLYRLNPEPLREIDRWLDTYRAFWATRLQRLKRFVEDSHD